MTTDRCVKWLAFIVPLMAGRISAQEQTSGGTIMGFVRDSASRPVAGADVMLRPSAKRTRTDSTGRFTLTGVDPASYTVVARKVGFLPETWDIKLANSGRVEVTIVLDRHIPVLDTVVTRADRKCPLFSYEAFLCRRGLPGGVFLDDEAITDKDVIYTGQLFEDMNFLRVDFQIGAEGRAYTLRTSRSWGCIKRLVNGHPYGIPPRYTSDLIALEVYPRGDRVPKELERYTMPERGATKSGPCTLIVYWTDQSPRSR